MDITRQCVEMAFNMELPRTLPEDDIEEVPEAATTQPHIDDENGWGTDSDQRFLDLVWSRHPIGFVLDWVVTCDQSLLTMLSGWYYGSLSNETEMCTLL